MKSDQLGKEYAEAKAELRAIFDAYWAGEESLLTEEANLAKLRESTRGAFSALDDSNLPAILERFNLAQKNLADKRRINSEKGLALDHQSKKVSALLALKHSN